MESLERVQFHLFPFRTMRPLTSRSPSALFPLPLLPGKRVSFSPPDGCCKMNLHLEQLCHLTVHRRLRNDADRRHRIRTYFVLASKTIRPGQVYRVIATVYRSNMPITVRASIQRNGVEIASASQESHARIPEQLLLRVPSTSLPGHYRLRVEGNVNNVLGGTAFLNETTLQFSQRSMTIFITTDKPVYMQGQTVRFRCVPVTTDLKAFTDAIDVYMLDQRGNVMKRWLSRQSNYGTPASHGFLASACQPALPSFPASSLLHRSCQPGVPPLATAAVWKLDHQSRRSGAGGDQGLFGRGIL